MKLGSRLAGRLVESDVADRHQSAVDRRDVAWRAGDAALERFCIELKGREDVLYGLRFQ